MPDQTKTFYDKRNQPVGYQGSKAGQSFPTSAEKSEAEDWTAYKLEKKLSFAASKSQYKADFDAWRKTRARKSGQAAGVAAAPSPSPSPSPAPKD